MNLGRLRVKQVWHNSKLIIRLKNIYGNYHFQIQEVFFNNTITVYTLDYQVL